MRSDLAESLFAAFVFRVDPILARGTWDDGTPLSDDDLAWIVALGHIMRMELFEPLPPCPKCGNRVSFTDGADWRDHRCPAPAVAPPPVNTTPDPQWLSESELRAMHGDR